MTAKRAPEDSCRESGVGGHEAGRPTLPNTVKCRVQERRRDGSQVPPYGPGQALQALPVPGTLRMPPPGQ